MGSGRAAASGDKGREERVCKKSDLEKSGNHAKSLATCVEQIGRMILRSSGSKFLVISEIGFACPRAVQLSQLRGSSLDRSNLRTNDSKPKLPFQTFKQSALAMMLIKMLGTCKSENANNLIRSVPIINAAARDFVTKQVGGNFRTSWQFFAH